MIALFTVLSFSAIVLVVFFLNRQIKKESEPQGIPLVLNKHFSLDADGYLLLDKKRLHDNKGSAYVDHIEDIFVSPESDIYVKKFSKQGTFWERYIGHMLAETIPQKEMKTIIYFKGVGKVIDYYTADYSNRGMITVLINL